MCNQFEQATAVATNIKALLMQGLPFTAHDITKFVRAEFPGENVPHEAIRPMVHGAMAVILGLPNCPYIREFDAARNTYVYRVRDGIDPTSLLLLTVAEATDTDTVVNVDATAFAFAHAIA